MDNKYLIKRIENFIKSNEFEDFKIPKLPKKPKEPKGLTSTDVAEEFSPRGAYSSPADMVGDVKRAKSFGSKFATGILPKNSKENNGG